MPFPATTPPALALAGVGGLAVGLVALLVLAVVGLLVVSYLRKRTLDDGADVTGVGFTLSDLRRLHASGEMSDEEYERARSAMVAGYHQRAEDQASAGAAPPASDPGDGSSAATRLRPDEFK